MKFCHMCGSQNEDSFIYCYACGEKLFRAKGLKEKAESTEYTEHQVEEPITEEETEMIAPVEDFFDRNSEKVYEPAEEPDAEPEAGANSRYSSYEPYSSDAYSAYSAPTPEPVVQEIYGYQYEPTEPEAPRSRSRSTNPFLIGGIVAALAVVIVLVGYFTDWFGSIEPIDKFLMTASNTMNATSGTVNLKASIDQHSSTVEYEIENLRYSIDYNKEDIKVIYDMTMDDCEIKTCLYNDIQYIQQTEDDFTFGRENDMEESIDQFFKLNDKILGDEGINWKKLVRELEMDEVFNTSEVEDFVEEFYREQLRDRRWLKDYLGFEKQGNKFIFAPDVEDMMEELIDVLLDSDVLEDDARDDLRDHRDDMLDAISNLECEIKIIFTIKGKCFSAIEYYVDANGKETELKIELSKLNKTKIREDELKAVKELVKDAIDNNYCEECGQEFYSIEQKSSHGDCRSCGAHGDVSYGNGLCRACYYGIYYRY